MLPQLSPVLAKQQLIELLPLVAAHPILCAMTQTLPTYLNHHFLMAMPHMEDPRFAQAVIYLCEHNADGAMGLVINQPSGLNLADVLEQTSPHATPPAQAYRHIVYNGGPVQNDRGFVLHRGPRQWGSSIDLGPLQLTTSPDILTDIGQGEGPEELFFALGYAGWGAGQLEQELIDNIWLSCPVDYDILFHLAAEQRLDAAARSLGVDLNLMTNQTGHA